MAVYCHGKWTVCMIKEGKKERERRPIPLLSLELVIYDRVLQIAQSSMDFHFVWSFSNVLDSIIYLTFNSQIATLIPHCTEHTHFHSLKICYRKMFYSYPLRSRVISIFFFQMWNLRFWYMVLCIYKHNVQNLRWNCLKFALSYVANPKNLQKGYSTHIHASYLFSNTINNHGAYDSNLKLS